MYQRVLLAYDGTPEGAIALQEGAILAKRCGAAVTLLSIVSDLPDVLGTGALYAAGCPDGYLDQCRTLLARGVEHLKRLGLECDSRLAVGDAVQAIGGAALELDADLVVVAHRKRSLLERWWSGNSGAYLADHIQCSLLVARSAINDDAYEGEFA